MTVTEAIAELSKRPPDAPLYVWDTKTSFSPMALISYPAAGALPGVGTLPAGAVVMWGEIVR
jgi:hypothetical protein